MQPFRAAVTALLADELDPAVGLRWFPLGTAAAGSLWDDKATSDLSDRWVKMARAAGAFTSLPVALAFHAVSESMACDFPRGRHEVGLDAGGADHELRSRRAWHQQPQ